MNAELTTTESQAFANSAAFEHKNTGKVLEGHPSFKEWVESLNTNR